MECVLNCLCFLTCFLHTSFYPCFIGIVAIILKIVRFFFLKCPSRTFLADSPKVVRLDSSSPQLLGSYTHLNAVPLCVAFLPVSEGYLFTLILRQFNSGCLPTH